MPKQKDPIDTWLDQLSDWWKASTRETFKKSLLRLIEAGVPPELAKDIMEDLYYAMRDEYGD